MLAFCNSGIASLIFPFRYRPSISEMRKEESLIEVQSSIRLRHRRLVIILPGKREDSINQDLPRKGVQFTRTLPLRDASSSRPWNASAAPNLL